jgi:hypothetical protein
MAFLRKGGGLWSVLFGRQSLGISASTAWPKFGGACIRWHCCGVKMAPCDWLGRVYDLWHFCVAQVTLPLVRTFSSISACPVRHHVKSWGR